VKTLSARIQDRAARAGLAPAPVLVDRLSLYLTELARWNRRINLTACRLEPEPDDAALDRLVVEPLSAARFAPAGAESLIDIGSGGGSPAIPLALALPGIRLLMVEMRARKAAFLKHASRVLELPSSDVAVSRLEDVAAASAPPQSDLASIRAVRFDAILGRAVDRVLNPGGAVLWFAPGSVADVPRPWCLAATQPLLRGDSGPVLQILRRT
jgi:16S rRNA (guanine527-N7)-methyltransferase